MKDSVNIEAELASTQLFAELTDSELEKVASVTNLQSAAKSSEIFKYGTEAAAIFVIRSGIVALRFPIPIRETSHSITIYEKPAGSVIGWSTLVAPYRLTMSAEASTDVELFTLEREAFSGLLDAEPGLHLKVMKNLSRVIGDRVAMLEVIILRDLQRQASQGRPSRSPASSVG